MVEVHLNGETVENMKAYGLVVLFIFIYRKIIGNRCILYVKWRKKVW